ncbi:MAG: thioredoxin reductase [Acidobacteriota bacterium]|nr:thioredoxin reductase [Acidobacteriota bacterium]
MNLDIAIIGAGPAGIAAAVQLKRFDLAPHVFEKNRIGGLLWNAHWVENYPGFPGGISGANLAMLFKNHLETFHIPVIPDAVTSLDYLPQQDCFQLTTARETYTANIVIAAPGTEPNTEGILDIIPQELKQYVVFEIFPPMELTGKKIVIVGAGDIAFDYALHLSQFQGNNITLVHRSEMINALPLLVRRVRATPAITMLSSAALQKVDEGDTYPLRLTFAKNADIFILEADILVGAIGRVPQTGFFSPHLRQMEKQLIKNRRLYMVGDVINGHCRQAVIAAGNGVEAAMKIYEYRKRGNR